MATPPPPPGRKGLLGQRATTRHSSQGGRRPSSLSRRAGRETPAAAVKCPEGDSGAVGFSGRSESPTRPRDSPPPLDGRAAFGARGIGRHRSRWRDGPEPRGPPWLGSQEGSRLALPGTRLVSESSTETVARDCRRALPPTPGSAVPPAAFAQDCRGVSAATARAAGVGCGRPTPFRGCWESPGLPFRAAVPAMASLLGGSCESGQRGSPEHAG